MTARRFHINCLHCLHGYKPVWLRGARHIGTQEAIRGHVLQPTAVTPRPWDVAGGLPTILASTSKS
jgi:hypothetical protein